MELLESVFYHLVLPPKVPGVYDHDAEAVAANILSRLLRACQTFQSRPDDEWSLVIRCLKMSKGIVGASFDAQNLLRDLTDLGPKDLYLIRLQAQNAALLMRRDFRESKDTVVFEVFETSPPAQHVLESNVAFDWNFPGYAAEIPLEAFMEPSFQENLTKLLEKAASEKLSRFSARATKAQNSVSETRDSTDPALITHFLIPLLQASGSTVSPPKISKHVRDDVNINQGHYPWRRSPAWLVLRVAVQRRLQMALDSEKGRVSYKFLICVVLADLLRDSAEKLEPELILVLRAKLCRRLAKLQQESTETSEDAAPIYRALFSAVGNEIEKVIASVSKQIHLSWETCKMTMTRRIPTLPHRADESSIELSLPLSGTYLRHLVSRHPSAPVAGHKHTLDYLPEDRTGEKITSGITKHYIRLAELEEAASRERLHDSQNYGIVARRSRCVELSDCVDRLFVALGNLENINSKPDQASIFILRLMTLWTAMDKHAIAACPLLHDFHPSFTAEALDVLQLASYTDMLRLREIQTHLRKRVHRCIHGDRSILDDPDAQCFAAEYFRSDADGRRLNSVLERIERHSTGSRDRKREEWIEACRLYDEMSAQISVESCVCTYNTDGSVNVHGCQKCFIRRKRNRMNIQVHEDFLPKDQWAKQAVVFELCIPPFLQAYRNVTWQIRNNLGHPPHAPSPSKPSSLIQQDDQLRLYQTSSARGITLASYTKSFRETHYRSQRMKCEWSSIDLPLGLSFEYYDTESRTWIRDRKGRVSFNHLCGIRLPSPLLDVGLGRPTDDRWSDGPTSYEIVASVTRCPPQMTTHEFMAVQKLLGGKQRRWITIVTELGASNVNLSDQQTLRLLGQLAIQAGPDDNGPASAVDGLGIVHAVFRDAVFCSRLADLVEARFEVIEANAREIPAMELLIALALRLHALGAPEVRARARDLIHAARHATLRWISHHRDGHRHAADADAARRAALYRLQAALLCRRTFAPLVEETGSVMSADGLESFVEASIALQQSLALDPANLPPAVENMLMRDMKTAHQMRSIMVESVRANPCSPSKAIARLWSWADQEQETRTFEPWVPMRGKNFSWIKSVVKGAGEGQRWVTEQDVHFNLVEGHLLVDGKPLGKLPEEILYSVDVKVLFGKQHLMTYPSPLYDMTHQLESVVEDHEIHFGHRGGRVIVKALYRDRLERKIRCLELIPTDVFRREDAFDLPSELIDDCVHWLDIDTGDLEIRRKPKIWRSRRGDWTLNVHTSLAKRHENMLVDPRSRICQEIHNIFHRFERPERITIFQPSHNNLTVRLKHLQLEFQVGHNGLLKSNQLQAEIDPDQDAGTLYGLDGKIVLQDTADWKRRSLIIGLGPLTYVRRGMHVAAWVDDPMTYTKFEIDSVLGRLTCSPEPVLSYSLALFHAVSSFPLPDPLTGSTGAEEAHRILSSGSCQPLIPLSEVSQDVLGQLEKLCPRRTFFPEKMRLLQNTEWNEDLTVEIQQDSYRQIIGDIRLRSSQLRTFDVQGGKRNDAPVKDAADILWWRAAIRRGVYERDLLAESQTRGGDPGAPYIGRSDDSHLQWAARVYQTVKSIHRRPFKMPRVPPLRTVMQNFTGNMIGGFDAPNHRLTNSLDALINDEIGGRWGSLINTCRNAALSGDVYDAVFRLALLSFNPQVDMDAIMILCAFSNVGELASLQPPPCSHFTGFRDGLQQMRLGRLETIIASTRIPNHDARSERMANRYRRARSHDRDDERLRSEARSMATFLLSQWPCAIPSTDGLHAEYVDIAEVMQDVQVEWTRVYNNSLLAQYAEDAQTHLDRHIDVDDTESLIPRLEAYHSAEEADVSRRQSVIPSLSSELILREAPKVQQPRIDDLYVLPPVGTSEPPKQAYAPEIDQLERVLWPFRASPRALWRQYGNDLLRSCDALRRIETQSPQHTSVPDLDRIDEASELVDRVLVSTVTAMTDALSGDDVRFRWLRQGALWPNTTPMALLRLLRSKDKVAFGPGMKELLVSYGVLITSKQLVLRMRNASLKRDEARLLEHCRYSGHENWDPMEHPDWLLLEIESNLLIRREQVEVANAIIRPSSQSNSVLQLNMGRGKTSCIVPMVAAVLADSKQICRIIVPKALLRQTAETLQSRIGGLLGREVKHIPFSRRTPSDERSLKLFHQLHLDTLHHSGVILAAPEHILSYKLCGFQRLIDSRLAEAENMNTMQTWLDENCRDVLDESDFTLAVKTQLIYPSGQLMQVDASPARWKIAQSLLWLVKDNVDELRRRFRQGIEVVSRQSGFPVIYIIQAEVEDTLRERLTDMICDGRTEMLRLPYSASDERTRNTLRRLLTEENPGQDVFDSVLRALGGKESIFSRVLILRGLLMKRILFLCLRKRWNVQYGLHPTRPPLAVPFEAKGVPSEHAEFGHPDVAILFTCLSFYYAGLSQEQFRNGLARVLKSDDPSAEYGNWTADCSSLPASLRHWNVIKADDTDQVVELWRYLRSERRVVDYYMNHFVFPRYAKQFVAKLQSSSWDIPLSSDGHNGDESEGGMAKTTGFSGTNDNRRLLPLSIKQDDLPSLSHTSAEVLTYLLQRRNRMCMVATARNGLRLSEENLLERLKEMGIRLLIDAGAYILEMDNYCLIRKWLDVDTTAQAGVYIDSQENRAWILYRGSKDPIPLLATPFAENLAECLVYLDEAHTRGTDLKLPPQARGALTLALGQTKDHTVQAAMRLRQLATSQSVVFCAPPEVYRSVVDLRNKPDGAAIDSLDVVHWLLEQTCQGNDQLQGLFYVQGVDFCRRMSAVLQYPDFLTNPQHRKALLEVLLCRERIKLAELYGHATSEWHRISPGMFHGRLGPMTAQLQILESDVRDLSAGNGIMEEVEQEREVEFQVEQVREAQKPQGCKEALDFPGLHPTIEGFARTGVLPNESGVLKATKHMSMSAPGQKFRLTAPDSRLLVSKEFPRTVRDMPKNSLRDTYMRPVEWVAWSPKSQTAVVLVPEEAELLIPILRSMAAKAPIHLIPYAASTTRAMVRTSRLASYVMPPLEDELPPWLHIELGVLGGRLYFEGGDPLPVSSQTSTAASLVHRHDRWRYASHQGLQAQAPDIGCHCRPSNLFGRTMFRSWTGTQGCGNEEPVFEFSSPTMNLWGKNGDLVLATKARGDSVNMLSRFLLVFCLSLITSVRAAHDSRNRPCHLDNLANQLQMPDLLLKLESLRRANTGSIELKKRDQTLEKREGLLGNVGNLVSGFFNGRGGGRVDADRSGGADQNSASGSGGADQKSPGGIGEVVKNAAENIVGRITNLAGKAASDAGFQGGVGAGVGAVQGLGFLSANESRAAGEKVSQDNGVKRSPLGDAVQESTTGFVATALRASRESNSDVDLGAMASALGSGIASGTISGLRLARDDGPPPANSSDVAGISNNFAFGFSRSIADNLDKKRLRDTLGDSQPNVGNVANGFARGLVTGIGDGIEAIGGVSSVVGGNTTQPQGTVRETKVDFDDSVGGLATGFGQGLGSTGAITLQRIIASSGGGGLTKRDDSEASNRTLTADMVSAAVQKAIELLSGPGVAGVGLVLAGLSSSGAVSVGGLNRNTTDAVRAFIPPDRIHFTSMANAYDVDGKQLARVLDSSLVDATGGIRINGLGFAAFVALVTAHVFLALVVFAFLFPLALTLDSLRSILLRVNVTHLIPTWTQKVIWMMWMVGIVPALPVILAFGLVVTAKKGHFQTAHGALSLLTVFLAVAAAALFILSSSRGPRLVFAFRVCNQLLLLSTLATFVSGLTDVGSVSLGLTQAVPFELAVVIGFALGAMLVVAQVVSIVDMLFLWRRPVASRAEFEPRTEGREKDIDFDEVLPGPLSIHKEANDGALRGWRQSLLSAVLGTDSKGKAGMAEKK
ncbi:hypothetical protein CP532_2003 [Ophiocordyceps camponoti-leonardi (nom. inval.)]|nr:hypothetical protein CP532_2003 [Ophiocordyceps camponoti-leonardi (nom. inval.)]